MKKLLFILAVISLAACSSMSKIETFNDCVDAGGVVFKTLPASCELQGKKYIAPSYTDNIMPCKDKGCGQGGCMKEGKCPCMKDGKTYPCSMKDGKCPCMKKGGCMKDGKCPCMKDGKACPCPMKDGKCPCMKEGDCMKGDKFSCHGCKCTEGKGCSCSGCKAKDGFRGCGDKGGCMKDGMMKDKPVCCQKCDCSCPKCKDKCDKCKK